MYVGRHMFVCVHVNLYQLQGT